MMIRGLLTSAFGALLLLAAGCSYNPDLPQYKPHKERLTYGMATRQLAPEPVYSRLTWVRAPEVMPNRELPDSDGTSLSPVYEISVKRVSLQEASQILASAVHYTSYCASTIAERKITLVSLGTIDELAAEIERKAGIEVQIDHDNRAVRFLASHSGVAPRFFSGTEPEVSNEVQSDGNKSAY